jgi:iron(III) transport system ATP-binding protein
VIRIKGLRKWYASRYGQVEALRGLDLNVAEREFCVLLGPSGCGKTTTLRCVAGLERPDSGEIDIDSSTVNAPQRNIYVPSERRDIGMVFQSYAIWPHMSVFQNVAFPLVRGRKKVSRSMVRDKVRQVLKLVQLDGLEERPATDLSGGQQQRVAMARAVVTEPKILLMDEPLSNLDARLRDQMRVELKKITRSIGVTTLYVTHDQAEALSLGDRVCVMHQGEILQIGTPKEVYAEPANLFVAQFIGEMNFIRATVTGSSEVQCQLGRLACPVPASCEVGGEVTLAVRPEDLGFVGSGNGSEGVDGQIVIENYLGDATLLEVDVHGLILRVKLPRTSAYHVGTRGRVVLPANCWRVYDSRDPQMSQHALQ